MEIMLDNADLATIEELSTIYPLRGVTSNPTIIKAQGAIDLYAHFRRIRELIGPDRSLHMQVVAADTAGMVEDAHRILRNVDERVYVKVPVNEPGLRAIQQLKKEGVGITATAIYSKAQALLAVAAGADYLAPYVNRMENLDIDAMDTIATVAEVIERTQSPSRIVAASFKNAGQVSSALRAGAHAVTVAPSVLRSALVGSEIAAAIETFASDWKETFGTDRLP